MQKENSESADSRPGRGENLTSSEFPCTSLLLCSSLALLETLYTTCCVDGLFLAGKEWVTRATDLNIDLWHR